MSDFFTPIPDAEVPAEHRVPLVTYRTLAATWGVPGDACVCYAVRAGFTLKTHAPRDGPCYEGYQYLQRWRFPDEPTADALVFWIPHLVPGSTFKTAHEQKRLLDALRTKHGLPARHLNRFGTAPLVAGLILAHHRFTRERIPFNLRFVRTDTSHDPENGLDLGLFGMTGLNCVRWHATNRSYALVGAFALGIERLAD